MPAHAGIHDLLAARRQIVDAGMRRHDDVGAAEGSIIRTVGMRRSPFNTARVGICVRSVFGCVGMNLAEDLTCTLPMMPFVVLVQQCGADQTDVRPLVEKDTHRIGAELGLLVQAFQQAG